MDADLQRASDGLHKLYGVHKPTANLMAQLAESALNSVMDANTELASRFSTHRDKAIASSILMLAISEWLEDDGRLAAAHGVLRIAQLETLIRKGD